MALGQLFRRVGPARQAGMEACHQGAPGLCSSGAAGWILFGVALYSFCFGISLDALTECMLVSSHELCVPSRARRMLQNALYLNRLFPLSLAYAVFPCAAAA